MSQSEYVCIALGNQKENNQCQLKCCFDAFLELGFIWQLFGKNLANKIFEENLIFKFLLLSSS